MDVLDNSFKYVKPYKVFATQIYQAGIQTSDPKRVDYIYVSQFVQSYVHHAEIINYDTAR